MSTRSELKGEVYLNDGSGHHAPQHLLCIGLAQGTDTFGDLIYCSGQFRVLLLEHQVSCTKISLMYK